MTVLNTQTSKQFSGSGTTGPFFWTFRFFANSEIVVVKTIAGVDTVLAETIDYTLEGAQSYTGGVLNLTTALLTGETLMVSRLLQLEQTVDLRNQGDFFPDTYEVALDKIVMQIQQVDTVADDATAVSATAVDTANTALATSQAAYIAASAGAQIFILQGSAGTVTVTRAAATALSPVSVVLPASGEVVVIKTDAYGFPVIIEPSPGHTVSGGSSISLTVQNESVRLLFFENNWDAI